MLLCSGWEMHCHGVLRFKQLSMGGGHETESALLLLPVFCGFLLHGFYLMFLKMGFFFFNKNGGENKKRETSQSNISHQSGRVGDFKIADLATLDEEFFATCYSICHYFLEYWWCRKILRVTMLLLLVPVC